MGDRLAGLKQKGTDAALAAKSYIRSCVDSIFEIRNTPANMLSVVWVMLCIRMCFGANYAETTWMDYALWATVACVTVVRLIQQKRLFTNETQDFFLLFAMLTVIMCVGLALDFSVRGIKVIISALCVYCFIAELLHGTRCVQIGYLRCFYHLAMGALVIYTISGVNMGNTIPGCAVFLTCSYVVAEYCECDPMGWDALKTNPCKWMHMLLSILAAFVISWESGARTASFVVLIVLFAFGFFLLLKAKHLKAMYWVALWGVVSFFLLCTFIRHIPFYEELDRLSNIVFHKNLDSSRSVLWRDSIAELSWWQFIIGKGTGTLPSLEAYANSSFHNSYLQLVMQNGILGLLCLLGIFRVFWVRLAKFADDLVVKFTLAAFTGLMIYNCFETTLLQNKTFLGFIQWTVLVLGLIRCRHLRRLKKVRKNG